MEARQPWRAPRHRWSLEDWALRDWGPERLRELDVEVPLEMSRGGGDYRDAFRDDLGTYAERELGARAFVAGHPARLRDFVDAFLLRDRDAPPRHLTAYLAQHDLLVRVPELAEACADTPPYVGRGDPRDDDDAKRCRARGPPPTAASGSVRRAPSPRSTETRIITSCAKRGARSVC